MVRESRMDGGTISRRSVGRPRPVLVPRLTCGHANLGKPVSCQGPTPPMSELDNANLVYLFPSPFLHHVWANSEQLNNELRERILAREKSHPGMAKTNVGGWHSEAGNLEWCGKAGEALLKRMFEAANYATYRMMTDLGRKMPDF